MLTPTSVLNKCTYHNTYTMKVDFGHIDNICKVTTSAFLPAPADSSPMRAPSTKITCMGMECTVGPQATNSRASTTSTEGKDTGNWCFLMEALFRYIQGQTVVFFHGQIYRE